MHGCMGAGCDTSNGHAEADSGPGQCSCTHVSGLKGERSLDQLPSLNIFTAWIPGYLQIL